MGMENLGIEYLAARLKEQGHEVSLLFDPAVFGGRMTVHSPYLARLFDCGPKIVAEILKDKPDAVAFSCFTGMFKWSSGIAAKVKETCPEIKTIFGGIHVTILPDKIISHPAVDAIAIGEAESSFPELARVWQSGGRAADIPGIWLKNDGEIFRSTGDLSINNDLDSLPFPMKELFYDKVPALADDYMIMTSRGCPFRCTFCTNEIPQVRSVRIDHRRRSVSNVIEELKQAGSKFRIKLVVFRDDIFTVNKKWVGEFSQAYKREIGLPYFCYSHPSLMDDEYAELLKQSGCFLVNIGVQSADPYIRENIMNRKHTDDQVKNSVAVLKKRGIKVALDHMIGVPDDSVESQMKAVSLYNEARPDRILSFWITYYPGTEILRIAREKGLVSEDDIQRIEDGETGHRFSGGSVSGPLLGPFRKINNLITLVPLLPYSAINFIGRKNRYRFIPGWIPLYTLLLFLNAVKMRDAMFFYTLKLYFSRKRVP